mgnify:FL=1|tara:strand:- start:353 stop:655 length:303 start_codon:yes stop_codon:yes gene_type:complete
MGATSALKIDKVQTVSGSQVMTLGTGGSIVFDGSFSPSNFGLPQWDGAKNRPSTNLTYGAFGWNSKNNQFECYVGVDAENNPLWAVFAGLDVSDDLDPQS